MSVQAEQPISFEGTQPLLAAAIAPCFAATTPVFSQVEISVLEK